MPYARSRKRKRAALGAASRSHSHATSQSSTSRKPTSDKVCHLLRLPRELLNMISELATIESPIHLRNKDLAMYHMTSPLAGVCHQLQIGLPRILHKLTPSLLQWVQEITVDVYNLDFAPLIDFLDNLTQPQMEHLKQLGTKITPLLRFGRCPRAIILRGIGEDDLGSLVEWIHLSTDPQEKWSSLSNFTFKFATTNTWTIVRPWLQALDRFAAFVQWFPRSRARRPIMKTGKAKLGRAALAIVEAGIEAMGVNMRRPYRTVIVDD